MPLLRVHDPDCLTPQREGGHHEEKRLREAEPYGGWPLPEVAILLAGICAALVVAFLSASQDIVIDAYRIEPAKLEAMRRDAAALAALSMGEEDLNEDARLAADRIHDLVDRSIDADYLGRRAYLTRARADMERIAA